MLSARRRFLVGEEVHRTPLIVPSYSSRAGGQAVADIIKVTREFVNGPILVSAYDVARNKVKQSSLTFATLVFLDSGGYEAGADADLSEVVSRTEGPELWRITDHNAVLASWNFQKPTVLVNFDTPRRRETLAVQISRALNQVRRYPSAAHVFLAKPTPSRRFGDRYYLDVDELAQHAPTIGKFDILGVTEKELGDSLWARLLNTAKLRKSLSEAGLSTPIHIFGSLDPVACPLFYLAGADIFDGLTWLRYGYCDGVAIYRQNMLARSAVPPDTRDGVLAAHVHVQNYAQLGRLQSQMAQFAAAPDRFEVFDNHGAYFREVQLRLQAEMEK